MMHSKKEKKSFLARLFKGSQPVETDTLPGDDQELHELTEEQVTPQDDAAPADDSGLPDQPENSEIEKDILPHDSGEDEPQAAISDGSENEGQNEPDPVEAEEPEDEKPEDSDNSKEDLDNSPLQEENRTELTWWQRLTRGLGRTSSVLSRTIFDLFSKRKLDSATLEGLEDALIQADLGLDLASRITERIGEGRFDKQIAPEEVRQILAEEIEAHLSGAARPLEIDTNCKPFVILMAGVNGAGKTTTIGKLASKFRKSGYKVMLAAGDTFRAAAIEQLKVWGDRTGCPVIAHDQGADAAGLAFDALKAAREQNMDILLIDTAGRLQNKTGLMDELAKIIRVIKKQDESAPHATLLVLDATVGQNAISQVETFSKAAGVSGLIMTKLDGTARGGILVALASRFGLPIHYIGVGEAVSDLEPFSAHDFACALAGIDKS